MIPNFDFITFDEVTHTYFNKKTKKKVPSVTTVLNSLQSPFDMDKQTRLKELETGIPAGIIKWTWDTKREIASNYGSRFHQYLEDHYNLNSPKGYFPSADKYISDYCEDVTIRTEFRVGNDVLAGTFDNLSVRGDGRYILKDWKTNADLTLKSDYKLLEPFSYLDKSKLTIYSLQLSLYRVLLDIPIYKMELVHFKAHDYIVYDLPFLEREARAIIQKLRDDNSKTRSRTESVNKSVF